MKKPFKKFKLTIGRHSKQYYNVYIFKSRALMREFSAGLLNRVDVVGMEAATHSYTSYKIVNGKKTVTDNVGCILFYKGGFGPGVVAHEMTHAINYRFLRNKVKFNLGGMNVSFKTWQEYDEAHAMMVGYMVNKFWKKCGVKQWKERY